MSDVKNVCCPNCEKEFSNHFGFCPHCGQKNKKLELNLKFFLNDFLSSSFNLDSKIFQTLRLLIFYPGKLTKEFLIGKRTKYLPPVRLYLIASLVYFTVLSFSDSDIVKWSGDENTNVASDSLQKEALKDSLKSYVPAYIDSIIGSEYETTGKNDSTKVLSLHSMNRWDNILSEGEDSLIAENKEGPGKWEKMFADKAKKLNTEAGKKNFSASLQKYTSIGMFVLMPITALIFYLLFYKNTYYIQHLVFVLHLQSVMYVVFIVLHLLDLIVSDSIIQVSTVISFLFILLIWINKFYEISWKKTIWKSILFLMMYGLSFSVFFLVIAAISAWNI